MLMYTYMHQAYEQSLRRAIVQSGVINDTCTFHVSKAYCVSFYFVHNEG